MNLTNIFAITIFSAFSLYLAFIALGVVGIAQNRKAQGLEERSRK